MDDAPFVLIPPDSKAFAPQGNAAWNAGFGRRQRRGYPPRTASPLRSRRPARPAADRIRRSAASSQGTHDRI